MKKKPSSCSSTEHLETSGHLETRHIAPSVLDGSAVPWPLCLRGRAKEPFPRPPHLQRGFNVASISQVIDSTSGEMKTHRHKHAGPRPTAISSHPVHFSIWEPTSTWEITSLHAAWPCYAQQCSQAVAPHVGLQR